MIELDQLKQQLASYDSVLKELKSSLDMDNKANRIQELEREMEAPDFWNDANESTAKTKEPSLFCVRYLNYNLYEYTILNFNVYIDGYSRNLSLEKLRILF